MCGGMGGGWGGVTSEISPTDNMALLKTSRSSVD